MNIAITGARGRLGRILREHFTGRGDRVWSFSRNADAAHAALSTLPEAIESGQIDLLLHMAWSTVPATAEKTPGIEWREDLPLLATILASLTKQKRNQGKSPLLVFFSSCAVYGESEGGQIFDEDADPQPKGWYAFGKLAGESLIKRFVAIEGLDALILRVTNPYGFAQGEQHLQGVIPALIAAAMAGKTFTSWGEGDAVKDYLHISDFSAAVEAIAERRPVGLLNLGSGASTSLQSVVKMVEETSGVSLAVTHEPAREWDVKRGRYSNAAACEVLGWHPSIDLAEGIRACVSFAPGAKVGT
jgi:UDP-glucose 4-epimerase